MRRSIRRVLGLIWSAPLRRDLAAGIAAGLVGAVLLGASGPWGGRASAPHTGTGWAVLGAWFTQFLVGASGGAAFAAVFRYDADSPAFSASGGLLFGLLWWLLGPLTLGPLLAGRAPSWTVGEADVAFPSLVAHVLYGAVLGLCFYTFVSLHARLRPSTPAGPPRSDPTSHVVILGGGFGGVSAAQRLEQLLNHRRQVQVTLVSRSNYLLFTPMLAEVASGGLEAHHIGVPLRAALPRTDVQCAHVETIDTARRLVWIRPAADGPIRALRYDHLVLALGSVPSYYGLAGLEAYAFSLKTLDDAIRLRNHVIATLESVEPNRDAEARRQHLTFVVVGGGFAGTEITLELCDLVHSIRRFYPGVHPQELRFILVHSGDHVLPELSPSLAAYALRKLRARGIEVLLNTRVKDATSNAVLLTDGRRLLSGTVVWTAGSRPNPLLGQLPGERNRHGAVIDDVSLRVKGLADVWAVGDCAEIPDLSHARQACPPTAQHAVRQGAAAAENVFATLTGRPVRPFRFRTIGTIVALGYRSAVAEWRGRQFSGRLAWFMWRTVYLTKLPGVEKKIRVALDWTIDLFFPRDIVLTTRVNDSVPRRTAECVRSAEDIRGTPVIDAVAGSRR